MDREKLTEQAKLRLFTGDQQFPANWSDVAEIAADFAIEQLAAVTAERDELKASNRYALAVFRSLDRWTFEDSDHGLLIKEAVEKLEEIHG